MKNAHRWLTSILSFAMLLLLVSGCTTVRTIPMKDVFPVSGPAHTKGTAVTLLPVEESQEAAAFKADQTYLGKGLSELLGYGPLPIVPFIVAYAEFHADSSRTDIIRTAVLSRLKTLGIPAIYQTEGGIDQFKFLPEDRLGITMRIRKLDVDTQFRFFFTLILASAFDYGDNVAHALLDCQLWQAGQAAPLWEGTVDGRYSTKDLKKDAKYQHGNVVGEAVFAAVDQCITKSGLIETRTKLSNQRYARLMTNGGKQATDGNTVKALDTYGQAYGSAMTPEQSLDAIKAMALLIQADPSKPVLPEEARKLKVQAEGAVREKKFKEAADLYAEALNATPWWPEGHFNRALVLGETGDYVMAMREMKHYLQLAPDAPNARAAQDKIYDWERLESKAETLPASQPLTPTRQGY